ncbi:hypothetical protein [Candidatus Odyssella thessalonicensis]|uniref:hypothetical protein n=1 Tax=Candidatus Odyssella thessalonicensis TaxID=84647 RepID=UPI000225B1F3|nr:hypothetical protein [Candidatus Odyssella thessalonicensis]
MVKAIKVATIAQEKQQSFRVQAAAIVHKTRIRVGGANHMAEGLKMHLLTLISSREIPQQKDSNVHYINEIILQSLKHTASNLERLARNALTIIYTLLINLQEVRNKIELERCLISDCLVSAFNAASLPEQENSLAAEMTDHLCTTIFLADTSRKKRPLKS